ncbi:MAG: non-homologous end-joining DNA ligase [Acidimicrobiia bacterium]|nr:non-homologous end-joining DNA ligase [Acidimicrobiia bacterium]
MVETSSPEKLIFPEHTKGEVVAYYRAFAARILPHVMNRPVTLERYPAGIGAKGIMQKNAAKHFPAYIGRYEVPKRDGTTVYPVITSADGVTYLANQGTVTFHIPTARIDEQPDRLIIDLDPEEGDVAQVRKAAVAMRRILDEVGLPPLLMTSGSKGYHLVVPLQTDRTQPNTAELAHGVAAIAAHRHPDLFTIEFLKKNRGGRVFVDWMRNTEGATAVAPYSLRARDEAPIAMPLSWDELADTAPRSWTLLRAVDRAEEAWPDFADVAVDPTQPSEVVVRALEEAELALVDVDRFGRRSE